MIYNTNGFSLENAFSLSGYNLESAYSLNGLKIFPDILKPVPSGNLTSYSIKLLPDIGNLQGFTCTGLCYDEKTNNFIVGNFGKRAVTDASFNSSLVFLNQNLTEITKNISLEGISGVQGVTIDINTNTIWFCCPYENKIYNINLEGEILGYINVSGCNGIAYNQKYNDFWILISGSNTIQRVTKNGLIEESYIFTYEETIDQCYLDNSSEILYITAGVNYTSRNNIYYFDTLSHEISIACTVDSYSIEGLTITNDYMYIANDGLYHSAVVPYNQINIYKI